MRHFPTFTLPGRDRQLLHMLPSVLLLVAACASTPPSPASDEFLVRPLQAGADNAGSTGQMTLIARGERTGLSILVQRVPSGTTLPAHLYTFIVDGRCEGQRPSEMPLTDRVLAEPLTPQALRGPYKLDLTVPRPLTSLRVTPHAVVVRSGPADGNLELFCGDI